MHYQLFLFLLSRQHDDFHLQELRQKAKTIKANNTVGDRKTCQDFIILGRGETEKAGRTNWTKAWSNKDFPDSRVGQGQGPV